MYRAWSDLVADGLANVRAGKNTRHPRHLLRAKSPTPLLVPSVVVRISGVIAMPFDTLPM